MLWLQQSSTKLPLAVLLFKYSKGQGNSINLSHIANTWSNTYTLFWYCKCCITFESSSLNSSWPYETLYHSHSSSGHKILGGSVHDIAMALTSLQARLLHMCTLKIVCVCVCVSVYVFVCMCVCVYVCVHAHSYIDKGCVYTYAHPHTLHRHT